MNRAGALLVLLLAAVPGCAVFRAVGLAPLEVDPESVRQPDDFREEDARVTVRHVLVAFDGSGVPGATRTKEEARQLAERVLADARAGRAFADLVRLYSDDRRGDGTYTLVNFGLLPASPDETERQKMVRGFGRLAFELAPGAIGLLAYDAVESPLGWHVILRVK